MSPSDEFRSVPFRARDGVFLGVCRGFARYSDINVMWIRLALVALFLFAGFWPALLIYFFAAVFMKPEPVLAPATDDDREFYNSYASDRSLALSRLRGKFDEIERRTRRIEDIVTARGYDWDRRLREEG